MAHGEEQALAGLYDQTSGAVFALAYRILSNRQEAEEVVLDTYMKAWRQAGHYDPSRGSVLTWLVIMTRSLAIDRLRSGNTRRRRTQALDPGFDAPGTGPDPEMSAWYADRQRMVATVMEQLPAEQHEALTLAFFSGMSHSELAEHLGAPLGTVKTRIRLGMNRMRELLREGGRP